MRYCGPSLPAHPHVCAARGQGSAPHPSPHRAAAGSVRPRSLPAAPARPLERCPPNMAAPPPHRAPPGRTGDPVGARATCGPRRRKMRGRSAVSGAGRGGTGRGLAAVCLQSPVLPSISRSAFLLPVSLLPGPGLNPALSPLQALNPPPGRRAPPGAGPRSQRFG